MDEREPRRVEIDGMELHLDSELGDHGGSRTALPPKVESWRRRSATGAILTGIALGLKQVLEPRRDEPAIVAQVSGEPVGELPVEADLNDIVPARSVVRIRPWLLAEGEDVENEDVEGEDAVPAGVPESGPPPR